MASVNKVILIGNLGKDPEVRTVQSGAKMMNLRLATNQNYKDKDGNWQEKVEWHQIVVWNDKIVDRLEQKLAKGATVYVEGEIQSRTYEKEGVERRVTEVVVPRFGGQVSVVSGGRDSGDRVDHESPRGSSFKKPAQSSAVSSAHSKAKSNAFIDDDVPFDL
jgi:single-strand DNA-binding protein